jgi:Family of unknown function (DUF6510)
MSESALNYLDGNAAAGELNRLFAIDITTAQGRCANCGTKSRFAEARLYMRGPGVVARCPVCDHVLLRLVNARERLFLDASGLKWLNFTA